MRGMTLGRTLFIGVALASVTCGVSVKKPWGLDVGNKEETGEFKKLLQELTKQDDNDSSSIGETVIKKTVAYFDLSGLSLSDICTDAIDVILPPLEDDEFMALYAKPGVLRDILGSFGFDDLVREHLTGTAEAQDLADLLTLESDPILYKAKFFEIREKVVFNLKQLRTCLSDPTTFKAMVRDILKIGGFEGDQVDEVMEIIDHPEMVIAKAKALLNDPMMIHEVTRVTEVIGNAVSIEESVDFDKYEQNKQLLSTILELMEADPAVAAMMEMNYAELMKDPAFLEARKSDGGGMFFNAAMGGDPTGGARGQQQRVEF